MVLIFLGAINLIFALSWLLHGCEKNLVGANEQKELLKFFTKDDLSGKGIKVEIFNACGVTNVAKKLTEYLRSKKVDVVFYDNFIVKNKIRKIRNTIVIDRRSTERSKARKIAKLINAKGRYVIHQLSPERDVDVTILVGEDYYKLTPFNQR